MDAINRATGSPQAAYTRQDDGTYKANVGNYHTTGAYGGVNLARMANEHGGISNPLSCGHTTKRDLYNRMQAFLAGIRASKQAA